MVIEIFCIICATALAVTGSLTFWPVTEWYHFYIPIVLALAGYLVGLFGFVWWTIDIAGRIIEKTDKKDKVNPVAKAIFMDAIKYFTMHAMIVRKVRGFHKLPRNQKFVLVCNHQSIFDSFITTRLFGKRDIAFISKKENMKIPLGPRLVRAMKYLAIDRDDKMQSLQVFRQAIDLVKNQITSIGVYPEGTRCKTGLLGEFHEGVFNIALHAQAPLVVMTTYGGNQIRKRWPLRSTKVYQDILCVIPYEDIKDKPAKEVSDMVRGIMLEHLQDLDAIHGKKRKSN
jgi:1-acyl-sn-glycerol-3-phosphate acyltransferase